MGLYLRTAAALIVSLTLFARTAPGQDATARTQLTAPLIEAYLGAQANIVAIQLRILKREVSGTDPAVIADMERIAKAHGLRDLAEYNGVLTTIISIFN